jgi:hypothetical protein
MYTKERSPLALPHRWEHGPVDHYHVVFWRQPYVPPEQLPEGVTQEHVMWGCSAERAAGVV